MKQETNNYSLKNSKFRFRLKTHMLFNTSFNFDVKIFGHLMYFSVPEMVRNVAIKDIKENSISAFWNATQGNNKLLYF